jgi:phosphatidylglycerol:prolipoprotein diacylglycerol transferase
MIILPFDPVAARLGPLVLTWHGLFTSAGIVAGLWLASRLAPVAGVGADTVWRTTLWVVGGGLVGARLLFAAEHPEPFVDAPLRLLLVNEGGISVFGAVLGGLSAAVLWARHARVSPARLLDAVAPGFLLGQAIGRIGDVVNGEHLGAHAPGLLWAVVYTHPDTLGEPGVPVHPAVAYELLWDALAAGVTVWLLRRHRRAPGAVLWLAWLLYGAGRLWTGFFQLAERVALGLGLAQLLGVVSMAIAVVGLLLAQRRRTRYVRRILRA